MDKYVIIGEERWPADTFEEKHAIVVALGSSDTRAPIAIVWQDNDGIAKAADVLTGGRARLGRLT